MKGDTLKATFDDSKPIFQQIADMISDDIIEGSLTEGDKLPSTTDLSTFYQINRATAQKGLASLVDKDLIYKQRGVGMFVQRGAKKRLLDERKQAFFVSYIKPMLSEAKRIQLTDTEVIDFIKKKDERTDNE